MTKCCLYGGVDTFDVTDELSTGRRDIHTVPCQINEHHATLDRHIFAFEFCWVKYCSLQRYDLYGMHLRLRIVLVLVLALALALVLVLLYSYKNMNVLHYN